jgi:peptidoglycan/LPS O-acetylase OafA/YrhL
VNTITPTEVNKEIARNRVRELDGLRGIAVLLIVFWHYVFSLIHNPAPDTFLSYAKIVGRYTWTAVDLFFVLSGFLIGTICIKKCQSKNFLKIFFAKRCLRILPPYTLLLISYFVAKYCLVEPHWAWLLQSTISDFWFFSPFQNIPMFLQNTYGCGWLSITWTLSIEEQFYLLAPFAFLWMRPVQVILLSISLIFLSIFIRNYFYDTNILLTLPARFDGMCTGILIAYFLSEDKIRLTLSLQPIWLGFLAFLFLLNTFLLSFRADFGSVSPTWFAVGFGICIIYCVVQSDKWFLGPLRSRILVFFGRISFTMYLFHQAVNGIVFGFFTNGMPAFETKEHYLLASFSFAITTLFSATIFLILERPLLRYSNSLRFQ